MVNLRGLDLNLLVVLDALLQEAHVSRAAQRVGLSQPATSNALERLRQLFGDPLLERNGRKMRLTPRAETLREPLREALQGVAHVMLRSAQPDLRDLRQTVRLTTTDLAAAILLPRLYRRLSQVAPGVDLVISPWRTTQAAGDALARGEIDLMITTYADTAETLRWERLLTVEQIAVMRRDHPAAEGFDLERWLAYPHILVSADGNRRSVVDAALSELGRSRRVGLVVSSFLLIPQLLLQTDLLALMPDSYILRLEPDPRLLCFPAPLPLPSIEIHTAWHPRREEDAAVQTVRRLLAELVHEVEV